MSIIKASRITHRLRTIYTRGLAFFNREDSAEADTTNASKHWFCLSLVTCAVVVVVTKIRWFPSKKNTEEEKCFTRDKKCFVLKVLIKRSSENHVHIYHIGV